MEVLKKGRKQKGWSMEYDCTGKGKKGGGCGARLLVSADDIIITGYVGANYGGDTAEPAFGFKCPDCGVKTTINENDIPSEIITKLIHEKNDHKPSY